MNTLSILSLLFLTGWTSFTVQAAIIVNPPMAIDRQLTVHLIQAREDNGTNPATVFGNNTQRQAIEEAMNNIWAQAGIDIKVLSSITTFDSSFALNAYNMGTGERPIEDFDLIFQDAANEDVLHMGNVINMIFVDHLPGFELLNANTSAGLASFPGNKITMYVGANLLGFQAGLEVISTVAAHEIGHNLGLDHTSAGSANLMAIFNGTSAQLDAAQIEIARSSSLLQIIPEPASLALMGIVFLLGSITRWRSDQRDSTTTFRSFAHYS